MTVRTAQGPLTGVRVIDVTTTFLGPYCTLLMAQMGADVIKIERPPHGDITRTLTAGRNDLMSAEFMNLNAGKRSIMLDLKLDDSRAVVSALLETADVFIHNMRPEAAARLGLSYDELAAVNATIVYCAAYGYGEGGQYAGRPAYDDIIQADSGFAWLQGIMAGQPQYVASVIADKMCGLTAAYAIIAALFERSRTHRGQAIEVPMFESMVSNVLIEHMAGMTFEPPLAPSVYARAVSPQRRPYKTLDGVIGLLLYTDRHWASFLTEIGYGATATAHPFDSASSRTANIDMVYGFIARQIEARTTDEWLELCERIDVPVTRLKTVDDLFDDPHLADVALVKLIDHPTEGRIRYVRNPVRFSGMSADAPIRPAPRLGEHGEAILEELGLRSPAHRDGQL